MCIWESKRSQIPSQASQHTLCHLCHQRGTGSCFKTFRCSSPAFHSPYKPPACQCPPCLWPRRGSGMSLIAFSLKAISPRGQEDVQRQTELYRPASELMKHKVNMIVAHKAPSTVWEILCLFSFFLCFSWLSFVDARLQFQVNHEKCMQVGWWEMSIEKSKQSGRCWRGCWCDKSCSSWQRLHRWEEEGGVRHGKRGAHYKVKFAQPYALGNGSKTLYSRVWFRVWLLMQSHLRHSDLCRALFFLWVISLI